jgi:3-hydroxyisobutyrate dehydrogenase-like beta-hydroxyacid dehydrogenase
VAKRLALIGFGEAASTFANAAGWRETATAYDTEPARRTAMQAAGVEAATAPRGAFANAALVLSLVTAGEALIAARRYAPHLARDTLWFDMNSVAPETKREAAQAVESAGARYIDAAILAPVQPAALNAPILLAGPAATAARAELTALGFANVRVVGKEVGQASAIKMIRSVMVKGIEALTGEMMAAAAAAGVADEVLASLEASERKLPWAERAAYNLERMAQHGVRRAEEMEQAAKTLSALGVEPLMTLATVRRQRDAARMAAEHAV